MNLQNFPRNPLFRRVFMCRPGFIRLLPDYSQIEMRIIAFYTKDRIMVDAFNNNEDLHERTANETGVSRVIAKQLNFGISYGMTEHKLSKMLKISKRTAASYIAKFYERYKGVANYKKAFFDKCRIENGCFRNYYGRTRHIPKICSNDCYEQARGEREAFSSLISGTAADMAKQRLVALSQCFRENKLSAHFCSIIHDEIWIDVCPDELKETVKFTKQILEDVPEFFPIPILVGLNYMTTNWAEKKGYQT
jgi:DNA polymerase-1